MHHCHMITCCSSRSSRALHLPTRVVDNLPIHSFNSFQIQVRSNQVINQSINQSITSDHGRNENTVIFYPLFLLVRSWSAFSCKLHCLLLLLLRRMIRQETLWRIKDIYYGSPIRNLMDGSPIIGTNGANIHKLVLTQVLRR